MDSSKEFVATFLRGRAIPFSSDDKLDTIVFQLLDMKAKKSIVTITCDTSRMLFRAVAVWNSFSEEFSKISTNLETETLITECVNHINQNLAVGCLLRLKPDEFAYRLSINLSGTGNAIPFVSESVYSLLTICNLIGKTMEFIDLASFEKDKFRADYEHTSSQLSSMIVKLVVQKKTPKELEQEEELRQLLLKQEIKKAELTRLQEEKAKSDALFLKKQREMLEKEKLEGSDSQSQNDMEKAQYIVEHEDTSNADQQIGTRDLATASRRLTIIHHTDIPMQKMIGSGGFANVFLGEYLGTPVVVKQLKNKLSRESRKMFLSELGVMISLSHPNVIQLIGAIDNPFALVMEYMDAGSVNSLLKRESLSIKRKLKIMRDSARGLNYLHSVSVIHGDVKPHNLLVDHDLKCKVGDFGLAIVKSSSLFATHVDKMTPAYAAPEMFNRGITRASDVFSFASTCYSIVKNGRRPFPDTSKDELMSAISDGPRPKLRGFPESLAALIKRGWEKDQSLRPTMKEFTECLNQLCANISSKKK